MNKDSTNTKRQTRQRRRKPPFSLTLTRLAFSKLGPIFPSILGGWAYRLWFSTRRFNAPRREKPWLENARSQVIELQGIPVMTYQWGEPSLPLVILVHGWNGRGSQMAAFAGPLLAAGFRVLSYDAPGHGLTPGKSTNIMILSKVLQALAEQQPVHGIIAHSFGGMTTSLALSQGMQAERVVVISTPSHFTYLLGLFTSALRIPKAVKSNLYRRIQKQFGDNIFEQISTINTCQQLAQVPALIIHDEKDHDVPVSQASEIQQNWPGSQLMITSGLGHKRVLYHQDVLDAAVNFLREN